MKLISLNTWGGKVYKPLIKFIQDYSKDTDIFCFQEVFYTNSNIKEDFGFRTNLLNEIKKILKDHICFFAPTIDNYLVGSFKKEFTNYHLSSGLAIFINKNLQVKSAGDFFVFRQKNDYELGNYNTMPRNIQFINFTKSNKKFTICNVHGIWVDKDKGDTPSRIKQSEMIQKFLDNEAGEKIVLGDFNLTLNTESIRILEENLRNLIKEYKILSTRSKFFPGDERYADFTLVSSGIKVIYFQVPNIEVSDHLPMILEFL